MLPTLRCTSLQTRIGTLTLGSTDRGLAMLHFGADTPNWFSKRFKVITDPASNRDFVEAVQQYLATGDIPKVPLDLHGTDFQLRCWNYLCAIPKGETRSYIQLARAVSTDKAMRAVGQANATNPVALIVPCHRVIAADGTLGGYGGGLPLKAELLKLEGARFRSAPREDSPRLF